MSVIDCSFANTASSDIDAQAADMASALRTLKPKAQHRKAQLFFLLLPVIVELLQKNVTQKSILELLEAKGLKLHPTRFKELMEIGAKTPNTETVYEENV